MRFPRRNYSFLLIKGVPLPSSRVVPSFRRIKRYSSGETSTRIDTESEHGLRGNARGSQRCSRRSVPSSVSFESESERQRCFVSCRRRRLHDGSSGSEEMNDHLDSLLVSKFQKHLYKINYISNQDLVRLYEACSFSSVLSSVSRVSELKDSSLGFSLLERKTWVLENNRWALIQSFSIPS